MPLFGGILRTAGLFKVGDYYYFNDPNNPAVNDWRFFDNDTYLDLQKYNGSIWVQEFRFGIPYVTTETDQDISGLKTFESMKLNLTSGGVCEKGVISWNTDEDVPQVGLGNDVCAQIPLENMMYVKNISGFDIDNGTPVYVSNDGNSVNNNIEIKSADASGPELCRRTLAMTTQDILNNEFGFVTTFGFVRDVDTDGYEEGDIIYVKSGGGYTNVRPTLPDSVTRLGFTTRGHAINGKIFINIQQQSINELMVDTGDLTVKTASGYTWVLDQPTWKDINLGAALLSTPAASQPDTDEFKDNTGADTGIETYAFAVGEKVSGSFEIQHDYKEGTDLSPHIHFQGIDAPTGTDKVQWQIIYTISRNGNILSPATTITGETDVDTQYGFYLASFSDIDGTGVKIGDQFLFQLSRIAASVDEYGGDALISTVGIHYQQDTNGSRQKFIK